MNRPPFFAPRRFPRWLVPLLLALPVAGANGQSYPSLSAEEFRACLERLAPEAERRGIPAERFSALTASLSPDPSVIARLDRQPEFVIPIWQYLANLVDTRRIQTAQEKLHENEGLLRYVEATYDVDAELVVAFWAVESNFGQNLGRDDLLQSLATLSCFGRRQSYFRPEFLTAVDILERGETGAERLRGSWAGAFGQTQFMPSTFARYAVDFDGDGKRDLYHSLPDVFASTANFLKQAGWRRGEPWAIEVVLPPSFDVQLAGRTKKRPTNEWLAMSLSRADGKPWPRTLPEKAALLLPAGRQGPALLAFPNYDAIFRYNAAESYALAIGLLYDALKDPLKAARFDPKQPFVQAWPTDDPPLTRSETLELQERLSTLGYDPGTIDGVAGAQTREALSRFQQECGGQALEADGWPGTKALEQLRRFEGGCNKTH
ncbi:MAG: hypothetical protein PWQ19_1387 [Tepidiphilus sp.]|uniref:Lytic murein transglycosylase n=1 Tax=Tepidiphilus thermophilus TaxID=876478 RepID=A0A0K6IW64_9PROT|nr:lytic murein transglycosylase [Tepidiphilus thermophilus]MDK2797837.1 hypothetical protein [Tepidiphilus sp.]CUB07365.1 lytic murein transglycosylase [Tepidiphilus thermophilus]